jgi:hypothetical protein
VEAILTRSLLERSAFVACAALEPQPEEAAEAVARTWRADMVDTADVLKQAGYPEAYVRELIARLDLQKATPKFSDRAAHQAFCATLGDWLKRLLIFQFSIPQFELKAALKR